MPFCPAGFKLLAYGFGGNESVRQPSSGPPDTRFNGLGYYGCFAGGAAGVAVGEPAGGGVAAAGFEK
jgi:hypothetical protein